MRADPERELPKGFFQRSVEGLTGIFKN